MELRLPVHDDPKLLGPMKLLFLIGLATLIAIPAAMSLGPSAEMPMKDEAHLERLATHVVTATVDRVYKTTEKTRGFRTTHFVAELTLETQSKGKKLPSADPLYVRWFSRQQTGRRPVADTNGHYGWAPTGGERVKVYLASRAYDGFDAKANQDGGFNAILPNGFVKLPKKSPPDDKPAKTSDKK